MKCVCHIKVPRNWNSSIITECVGVASVSGDDVIKTVIKFLLQCNQFIRFEAHFHLTQTLFYQNNKL